MTPASLIAGVDRAPGLVVLGFPRCGTTSLASWLTQAGVGVGVKDSFYLMDDDAGLRGPTHLSTGGVEGYLSLFHHGPEPTAEVSAGYAYQRRALSFFSAWATPPQFAVVVRDPVHRLRSVHRYFTGNLGLLPRTMSFSDYVDRLFAGAVELSDKTVANALEQGCYSSWLAPWVRAFGRRHVHLVRFEDLHSRPSDVVGQLIDLAGGGPPQPVDFEFAPHNQSIAPRSRPVAGLMAWGRTVVPRGRARSWAGERLRRLQADPSGLRQAAPEPDAVLAKLHDYYARPNQDLTAHFGISTAGWA